LFAAQKEPPFKWRLFFALFFGAVDMVFCGGILRFRGANTVILHGKHGAITVKSTAKDGTFLSSKITPLL
jgi:hypothetical protein